TDDTVNTVTAFVGLTQDPVTEVVSDLAGLEVVGMSRAKPNFLLMSLVLDFSRSLNKDRSASDTLEAFGVSDGSGGAGANGVLNADGVAVPDDVTQLALPYGMTGKSRVRMPWLDQGADWPWLINQSTGCTVTTENECGGTKPPHRWELEWNMSNQFLAYKKAAVILTGVAAQATPHLEVDLLGGLMPSWVPTMVNGTMYGTPPDNDTPYTEFVNDGVFNIWSYKDPSVSGYTLDSSQNPPLRPVVSEYHSVANPKDVFVDNVLMDLRYPTYLYLTLTGYRKLIKYGTFTGAQTGKVINPGTYSSFVDPPLPFLENEKFNPPPEDSFPWAIGSLVGSEHLIQNELHYPWGFPFYPMPLLTSQGDGHPTTANLHIPVRTGYIYSCNDADPVLAPGGTVVGPSIANNAPLSQDPLDTGWLLCNRRDFCDDGLMNNSPQCDSNLHGSVSATEVNVYYNTTAELSPRCADAAEVPRCEEAGTGQITNGAVWCAFGDSSGNMVPRCSNQKSPRCMNSATSTFTANIPLCTQFGGAPRGHGNCDTLDGGGNCESAAQGAATGVAAGVPPISLGTVSVPATPPTVGSNLFYYINDMGPLNSGTLTHNSVPVESCEEFQLETDGQGQCGYILVTDGRPISVDSLGQKTESDADLIDALSLRMTDYTQRLNGKSFTWYLGRSNSWQGEVAVVQQLEDSGALSPAQISAFNEVKAGNYVCGTAFEADWESIPDAKDCPDIDTLTLQNNEDTTMTTNFQAIMDDPDDGRYWVDTALENDITGPSISGSLSTFLGGLKYLLALLKREPQFEM
ncbi:hypothetical protein MRY87_12400, partial [bacterium]|nr:hypothetical protein [bacterium]